MQWNNALGSYYFNPKQNGRAVTLYIDRRRIENIGAEAKLGDWQDFLAATNSKIETSFKIAPNGIHGPFSTIEHLLEVWQDNIGTIEGVPIKELSFPPILIGMAILVLAVTENKLPFERSYYERLDFFLQTEILQQHEIPETRIKKVVYQLLEALPKLQNWVHNIYGNSWGKLLLGQSSNYRWVGAIQFHAILDPEEREALPFIWNKLQLRPKQKIEPQRLTSLLRNYPKIEQALPSLCKAIKLFQVSESHLLDKLLAQEFEAWTGETMLVKPVSKTQIKPKLRVKMEDQTNGFLCIEWPEDTGPWEHEGCIFDTQQIGQTPIWRLIDRESQTPLYANEKWLFEDVTITNLHFKIRRKSRNHVWLWSSAMLGLGSSGYIEKRVFLHGTAFHLLVNEQELDKVENWFLDKRNFQFARKHPCQATWTHISGAFPKSNPFKSGISKPIPDRIRLNGDGKISKGIYRSELPIHIQTQHFSEEVHLEVSPLSTQSREYKLQQIEGGVYKLILSNPLHPTAIKISALDNQGSAIDSVEIMLQPSEALPIKTAPYQEGFASNGQLKEDFSPQQAHFIDNHFYPNWPSAPIIRGFIMPHKPSLLSATYSPKIDLGALMIAAANQRRQLPLNKFRELVNMLVSTPPLLSIKETNEIRRAAASLGFFHYKFQTQTILLSPMQLVLLPDNFLQLRAVLLGSIPFAVANFIEEWSNLNFQRLQLNWLHHSIQFVPPIPHINCMSIKVLDDLVEAINQKFPNVLNKVVHQSLSETMLSWLDPLPDIPDFENPNLNYWTSFQAHLDRFDPLSCGFVQSESQFSFPILTRTKQKYGGSWKCIWWESESKGLEINHQNAIPILFAKQQIPYIGQNALRGDQIVIAGNMRQSNLLERAIIAASAQLPETIFARQIREWKEIFHPEAKFRVFNGIRPGMLQQLHRIFQNAFKYTSSTIPQIHIDR